MNLGNKIKSLRKRSNITQEQLADILGVTFQAVSKWENNITLPDITLAPLIAAYFGISMDELFDFSLKEMEIEIESIVDDASKYRESDPDKSRRILEMGLEKYPEDDILLNNLLYVMNYSENPNETIETASKLIEKTLQSDIKYDALRFLAYAYKAKGDLKSAERAIEQIPEIYFSRLTEEAFLFDDERKFSAAEKQKWLSFENLLQMIEKVAEYYEDIGQTEKAVGEINLALQFLSAMNASDFDNYVSFFEKKKQKLTNMKNV